MGKIFVRFGGDIVAGGKSESTLNPDVNCSYSADFSACPRAHVGIAFSGCSYVQSPQKSAKISALKPSIIRLNKTPATRRTRTFSSSLLQ